MDKDKELKQLMRSYYIPAVPGNLAQDIIDSAARVSQKRGVLRYVYGLFEEFRLPAPIFCVVLLMVVGFLAGATTYTEVDSNDIVGQLLYGDENLL